VKSAEYQIGAQDAVVHQQMAAYYPTIDLNNSYRTSGSSGGSSGGSNAFDTVSSAANVTMTLYNFGKREGSVQSAKDTLDATRYAYNTTSNNIVLAVKQAYYGVLQANALVRVNEETVKDRAALLRQTRGFYDVGTKPKSDVTLAEANLYLAQANLIVSQNSVETAWASLRNAMGVDDFPKQPLAEELTVVSFAMTLNEAQEAAYSARPELLQFKSLLKAQDELIMVARRNHLPDILFSAA
jgi:outer membrane protein TolC